MPLCAPPNAELRLYKQPCLQTLLQGFLLASAAAEISAERRLASQGREREGLADSLLPGRLALLAEFLARDLRDSPLAECIFERAQHGLLMRCIDTYLRAAKMELQGAAGAAAPFGGAAKGQPCQHEGGVLLAGAQEKEFGEFIGESLQGRALVRLLRLLNARPQLLLRSVAACMRKTEPLVAPFVFGLLLKPFFKGGDDEAAGARGEARDSRDGLPQVLFKESLRRGLLESASLYLLPIQNAKGPLQASPFASPVCASLSLPSENSNISFFVSVWINAGANSLRPSPLEGGAGARALRPLQRSSALL